MKGIKDLKVTVYSKDQCGQCLGVKMFLASKGFAEDAAETPLVVKAVDKNEEYLKEFKDMGFSSLPVTIVEDDEGNRVSEPLTGFNPGELTKVFGKVGL